jgi:hypothetical protein
VGIQERKIKERSQNSGVRIKATDKLTAETQRAQRKNKLKI